MAEIVDSIVAELIVRDNGYIKNFHDARKAVDDHTAALKRLQAADAKSDARAGRSGANARATSAKTAATEIKKAAKETAAAEKAAAKASAAAVRAAEREKQVALKATRREQEAAAKAAVKAAEVEKAAAAQAVAAAEREAATRARLAAVADRAIARKRVPRGSGRIPNTDLARGGSPLFIPTAALTGGETAELDQVDHLTRDIAINKARLVGLEGQEREELQREIRYLEQINRLKRAGVGETEAIVLAEKELAATENRRGLFRRSVNRGGLGQANQFALSATRGRFGYSFSRGAIGGAAVAIGAGIGIAAIDSTVKYGQALKNVSEDLGITTRDLQVYQKAARDAGLSNDQLNSAFGQLAANLGKAKLGAKDETAMFKALGINIKNVADTGQLLPTLIDRLSRVEDQSKRSELEVELFGKTGEKLDSLLSGGTDRVNDLAKALEDTGHVLSDSQIRNLDETARKLADVKAELQVEFASVVANNADSIERLASSLGKLTGEVLGFLDSNPEKAVAILGGVSGFAVGGLPGAVIGAGLGLQAGIQRQEANARAGGVTLKAGPDGKWRPYNENGKAVGAPTSPDVPKVVVTDANGNPISESAQKKLLGGSVADTRKMLGIAIQEGNPDPKAIDKLLDRSRSRRGKSASTLEREADQRQRRFESQLARYEEEQLRAQADITGDISRRADIEKQIADRELKRQNSDIDLQAKRNIAAGADQKIEQARAKSLKAEAKKAHDAEVEQIEQRKGFDLARAQNDTDQRILRQKADHLNSELSLADTSEKRRRIELELLANSEAEERSRLQGVISTNPKDSPQAAEANAQLKALPEQIADQRAEIMRQTETSLESYRRTLEVTGDTISDFGVHVLQDFNGELDHSIAKALHLHGIFGEIVGDIIDMAIKQQLISPIANSGGFGGFLGSVGKLLGIGGGSGFGSTIASNDSFIDSAIASIGVGFAGGGSGIIGGRPGIDQNLLSINGSPVAKVGRGELLSVSPNVALSNQRIAAPQANPTAVSHYHITVRAENSVTPAGFAQGLAKQILSEADRMDTQRQRQTLTAAPHRVASYQNLGS